MEGYSLNQEYINNLSYFTVFNSLNTYI